MIEVDSGAGFVSLFFSVDKKKIASILSSEFDSWRNPTYV